MSHNKIACAITKINEHGPLIIVCSTLFIFLTLISGLAYHKSEQIEKPMSIMDFVWGDLILFGGVAGIIGICWGWYSISCWAERNC